jgi:hypothetical protein
MSEEDVVDIITLLEVRQRTQVTIPTLRALALLRHKQQRFTGADMMVDDGKAK